MGASLLALLVVLGGGFYLYLRSALPQTDGRIVVAGPKAEIRIERDADGVPLITARDDEDIAFGLGFVHAQERLFQMELQRRYGAGRLAEIFGPQAVAIDRQMRVLGLYRAAEAEIPFLSPEMNRALEAYAAGVNAFLGIAAGRPAARIPAAGLRAGTVAAGRQPRLGQADGSAARRQLPRRTAARPHGPDDLGRRHCLSLSRIPERCADDSGGDDPDLSAAGARPALRGAAPVVGPHYASNNWVVDGEHSASGKPLLANDPHLAFGAPGFWYLARLKTPQHQIAGGTAAGVPLVVIGHNERIAWGFTTTTAMSKISLSRRSIRPTPAVI